ncbi:hypothetical protein HY932_03285 [Candidatus Falkowbacteria bacterium]|nr:hypothetical protein [Candidatus Falkowbacteria bacterium]
MRHPARLYIAFSAFVLFISMTVGMLFWFSMQTVGMQASEVEKAQTLVNEYQQQMNKFFSDYSAATDKVAFLKDNQHILFEIKVPKEYKEQHMKIVTMVNKVVSGEVMPEVITEFQISNIKFQVNVKN